MFLIKYLIINITTGIASYLKYANNCTYMCREPNFLACHPAVSPNAKGPFQILNGCLEEPIYEFIRFSREPWVKRNCKFCEEPLNGSVKNLKWFCEEPSITSVKNPEVLRKTLYQGSSQEPCSRVLQRTKKGSVFVTS